MRIDDLMYAYKNCHVAYDATIQLERYLTKFKADPSDLISDAEKIRKIGMNELEQYKIINKKDLTQMTIEEYYDNFDIGEYSDYIDCDNCHFETCIACIANLIEDLYNFSNDFGEEFDRDYKIVKVSNKKE